MCPLIVINQKKQLEKLKCLIDAGENVNSVTGQPEDKYTPLSRALSYKFDDSYIELLITSGGVVYTPITGEQQARVNKIMRQVIDKITEKVMVMQEVFADKKLDFCILPIELKRFIGFMAIDNFAPEVALKIIKINKMIEPKTSKNVSDESSAAVEERTAEVASTENVGKSSWGCVIS